MIRKLSRPASASRLPLAQSGQGGPSQPVAKLSPISQRRPGTAPSHSPFRHSSSSEDEYQSDAPADKEVPRGAWETGLLGPRGVGTLAGDLAREDEEFDDSDDDEVEVEVQGDEASPPPSPPSGMGSSGPLGAWCSPPRAGGATAGLGSSFGGTQSLPRFGIAPPRGTAGPPLQTRLPPPPRGLATPKKSKPSRADLAGKGTPAKGIPRGRSEKKEFANLAITVPKKANFVPGSPTKLTEPEVEHGGLLPPKDNLALWAWASSIAIVGLACGAAGGMALFLNNAETLCALVGWLVSVGLILLLLEPAWILAWAIILTVQAAAEKRRRRLATDAEKVNAANAKKPAGNSSGLLAAAKSAQSL